MRVLSVEIENFLSIEKASVEFDSTGLLLIEGYNYDVDRANGAGKTAILNALSYGIYERLPRKITASEVLRRGAKKASVTVTLESAGEILVVKRFRPKGVAFFKQVNGALDQLTLTQAEWESKLRLSYNQFIVSMYCSQANNGVSPRFLLLNDADKKQFLLQLLDLEEFSLCKKRADEGIQQILAETNLVQQNINIIQSKIEALSESIVNEDELRLEIAKQQEHRLKHMEMLAVCEAVPKPDLAKFLKLEEDISAKRMMLAGQRAQRDILHSQWTSLGRKIRPFSADEACQACGTVLDNTHAKAVHEAEMIKLNEERVAVKNQLDKLDGALLNESKLNELSIKIKDKKRQESLEYERASLQRVDLLAKIRALDGSIELLSKRLSDNSNLLDRISTLRNKQIDLESSASTLAEDLEVQKTVSAIYSPTGAQAYVLDSAVALFNEHIAKYTSILWSNLTYELQSYKETVRGEVTAKFSESIVMDGRPISLGSLSGGELRALSICADMALIDLLEQQFGIHMSPIIFDEAFDGLDSAGKEFALELVQRLANDRQVIVIDHASEVRSSFDKVLRVEKRNGVSTVSVPT